MRSVRFVSIDRWEPEKYKEMSERFFAFLDGKAPEDVLEAYKKIKFDAFDFPSVYGRNCAITVGEGDETSVSTFSRYWADLGVVEVMPSVSLENLKKFGPKR